MKKLITLIILFSFNYSFAQQLPIETTNNSLDSFIKYWIGKPYQLGGNSEAGIDCSNFVVKLYNKVYNSFSLSGTCRYLWKETQRITKDVLVEGDLVFFNSPQSPSGWHVGVYLGNNQFIHAANTKEGVKISSLDEPFYKEHYKGGGRLKL
jgi:lipoprotein Spr